MCRAWGKWEIFLENLKGREHVEDPGMDIQDAPESPDGF
jgi:hypothetical protein